MLNKKLINSISSLIQVDIDSIFAYKQAIKNIENDEIKQKLLTFVEEHDNHIKNLSKCLNDIGGKAPELKEDIKGYVLEGFTTIATQLGLKPTLKMLQQNVKIANKKYKEALDCQCDNAALKMHIKAGAEDIAKQLEYLEEQLNCECEM